LAEVNPPIRPREDLEFLCTAPLAGEVDGVVRDHACCRQELKVSRHYFGSIWTAKSGFGGTEYLHRPTSWPWAPRQGRASLPNGSL